MAALRRCVVLMCIAAAGMALSAYLIGTMTNEAYVNHNFRGIVIVGVIVMAVFTIKGIATYGGTVMLSYVGNRIVADNQRRMFDKLLRENMGFFADRHSSEFIARLTTGANSVSQVINLLITAIGRDLMSLIGLCAVMVIRDPVMSIAALMIAPPALFLLRKLVRRVRNIAQNAVHRRHAHHRDHAGGAARAAHGEGVLARRRDAAAARRQRDGRGSASEQDGARRQSLESDHGDARRFRHCAGDHLWRLSRHRRPRHAG